MHWGNAAEAAWGLADAPLACRLYRAALRIGPVDPRELAQLVRLFKCQPMQLCS